jgi:hypothetical protein
MIFDRFLLPNESKNVRENHGQCGGIAPCSHGYAPARFGNSSEKVVHQILESGNLNVQSGLLGLCVTWCHL